MPDWGSFFLYPPVMGLVSPGRQFETQMSTARAQEQAVATLSNGMRRVEIGGAKIGISYLTQWEAFQNAMKGRFNVALFRFNSPLFEITGETIGTGDGAETEFQLQREIGGYTNGPTNSSTEIIRLPLDDYPEVLYPGSTRAFIAANEYVRIFVNGVEKTRGEGNDFTVEREGGVVTFAVAPANGAVITATCKYFILVRQSQDFNPAQASSESMVSFTIPGGIFVYEPRNAAAIIAEAGV